MTSTAGKPVRLSDRAHAKIRSLMEARGARSRGVRLFALRDADDELELGLSFDASRDGDRTFDLDGLTLAVDPESLETAGELTIDYEDSGQRQGFLFLRGKRGCQTPIFAE